MASKAAFIASVFGIVSKASRANSPVSPSYTVFCFHHGHNV